ncbi:conserved hypothetical protein [Bradyrhizobium sp. STM 3843]|uniref:GIY-YIG nuclease family protein n=1 Tax=Bradyrhizobium sp. STM 3843 TaxID=551947 RepID=UPI0002403064|nr:GIY-YIG nuclease family protein [Bradyrhizobium sp. STM 3843]CCE08825.1 conserved hypothetical protein [Bradyrhizobium sp. STM 3843]
MDRETRKAAIAAYKERKTAVGIYAVLCTTTGQRWIGRAADLEKIQNRLWFTLRQGGCRLSSLQAAWSKHGPEAFMLEVIEPIEDEALPYVRDRLLTERLAHWCQVHGAEAI